MRRFRPWLLALALSTPIALSAVPSPALAQAVEPIPEAGLVEFLPVGQITGDGQTTSRLYVLALGSTGTPMIGLEPRLTTSDGLASGWVSLGSGLYSFDFLPPRVAERTSIAVSLKGKVGSTKVERDVTFEIGPPLAHQVTLATTPDELVVGEDLGVDLVATLVGPSGQPLDGADVLLRASEGEVKALKANGDGTFAGRYVPKKVNYPHIALITAADARQPEAANGYTVVRLSGKVDYPILAPAGAQVSLEIAGQTFGPVTSSSEGRAAVPVVVPPGVPTGTVTTVKEGETTSSQIDLRVPETRRIVLFPTPVGVPADPGRPLAVRALVRSPSGVADTTAKVVFEAIAGTISGPRHLGDGVYEATWSPPAVATEDVEVSVRLEGEKIQRDAAAIDVVSGLPALVEVTADPPVLDAGATALSVVAAPQGPDGEARADLGIGFVGGGAKLDGEPVVGEDGVVRASFVTNPTGPVEILVRPKAAPTGNPMRHLLVLPGKDRVTNDGASATPVAVVATDGYGQPIPGVAVSLDVVGADGTVTPTVTTDANGVGLVLFTAGRRAGLSAIRARTGTFHAAAAVLQVPPSVPALSLPPVGGTSQVAVVRRWDPVVTLLRVEHGGEAATGWAAVAEEPPAEEPTTEEPAEEDHPVSERPASPAPDEPWLRARAGYIVSSYQYEQVPNGDGGQLIDQVFAIGGERGGQNAVPQGFEVDGRAWLPMLPYLGFQAHYRAGYYGVTAEIFGDQVARDALHDLRLDVLGRYFFDVDRTRLHAGARAGFHLNDFIYFSEERTDQQVLYRYDTLAVPSLALGGELGGDVVGLFFVAGGEALLAYGGNPFGWGVDATVGYDVTDNISVSAGFEALYRQLDLVGAESGLVRGRVDDGLLLGRVSVGTAF